MNLLERYDLVAQRQQLAGTMSGGQKQRLALACAVLHHPELLLLDEPTSAVDPQSRRDFWANLFRLAEAGTTIMVSTHYMDEAERCHRLAILDRGVKVADGTPQELQAATGMHIVEVIADDPYAAQAGNRGRPEIASVTQLGVRLRVLIPDTVRNPIEIVKQCARQKNVPATRPCHADPGRRICRSHDATSRKSANEVAVTPRRIIKKEVLQLSRDRLTFGMVFGLPIIQMLLFGYAINTDVRNLRTAVANQAERTCRSNSSQNCGQSQVVRIVEPSRRRSARVAAASRRNLDRRLIPPTSTAASSIRIERPFTFLSMAAIRPY